MGEKFLVTVNAGSDTITSFLIERDLSLTKVSTINSGGVGPNSLAYSNGRLFVSNIDRDGFANGGTTGPEVFGTTDGFIDLDVTTDGNYLYQLEGLSGEISAYKVEDDSSLTLVQDASGFLPEFDTQGLVTFQRSTLLGDANFDGTVNFLDIAPFIQCLSTGQFYPEVDINVDGEIDFLDISPFISLLSR